MSSTSRGLFKGPDNDLQLDRGLEQLVAILDKADVKGNGKKVRSIHILFVKSLLEERQENESSPQSQHMKNNVN